MFLRRLTDLLQSDFDITLLDLRKVDGKTPLFEGHVISPFRNRLLSISWLQWRLLRQRHGIVHFHFSDVKGLIFAALLLMRNQAAILTLHHGAKDLSRKRERVLKLFAPLIRRKIGTIHALNADQRAFYQSIIGFRDEAVFQCPTHISPNRQELAPQSETAELLEDATPYVLTSGVGNRLNRADLVLDYWAGRKNDGMHLVVSIYGDSDPDYVAELKHKTDALETTFLVGAMPENDFNAILKSAVLYVRPAEVDSFGIAVADALSFGTPVLASDACDRAKDVHVFNRFDMVEMGTMLEALLASERDKNNTVSARDRSEDYRAIYSSLASGKYGSS